MICQAAQFWTASPPKNTAHQSDQSGCAIHARPGELVTENQAGLWIWE